MKPFHNYSLQFTKFDSVANLLYKFQLKQLIMGNKSTSGLFPESRHYSILDYGYCKVWKRNDTHKQTMEQYDASIENQTQLTLYKKMWQLRMKEEGIVGVYYFTHSAPEEFCAIYQKGSILTERIPYRLSQFCNIPYEEVLTIIRIALQSFKTLHIQYGLFSVRSTMIGVNFQNQIKVWLHTDFSSPQPENSNCPSIFEMIDSIVQAVESNADTPYDYVKFSEFVKVNKQKIQPSFDEMLEVLQIYKHMNKIADYEGTPRLEYYLRRAEGWQQASFNSNFLSNMALANKESPQRRLEDRQVSQKSFNSSKTLKAKNPAINIYTHREVNQLLARQKYLTRNLTERQVISDPHKNLITANLTPVVRERENYLIPKQNQPSKRDSGSIRHASISPATPNKIEFKIFPSSRRSNTPINQLVHHQRINNLNPTHSSIESRIPSLNQRLNIQGLGLQPSYYSRIAHQIARNERRNRFEPGIEQRSQTNSLSRSSSLNFIQPLRAQY